MNPIPLGDMPEDEFRDDGHRLVDWIAGYLQWSLTNPVLSRVRPGAIRAQLPAAAPEQGEPFERILEDVGPIFAQQGILDRCYLKR